MDALRHVSHIERHSECVAGMAEALARRAVETGATRHPELVALSLAAGLLHDIAKSYTVQFRRQPCQIGASWVVDSTGNHKVAQPSSPPWSEWPLARCQKISYIRFFSSFMRTSGPATTKWYRSTSAMKICLSAMEKANTPRAAIHRGWEHSKTIERVLSAQLEFPLHESTVVGGRLVSRA